MYIHAVLNSLHGGHLPIQEPQCILPDLISTRTLIVDCHKARVFSISSLPNQPAFFEELLRTYIGHGLIILAEQTHLHFLIRGTCKGLEKFGGRV